jgi:hypothetical protein
MATERMNESWRRIKTFIEDTWDEEDFGKREMRWARGDLNRMVTLIEGKTGEPRRQIRRKISGII